MPKPLEKIQMMFGNNTYKIDFICMNCDIKQKLKIKKGKTVEEVLQTGSLICNNCGNQTLMTFEDWSVMKNVQRMKFEQEEQDKFNHFG